LSTSSKISLSRPIVKNRSMRNAIETHYAHRAWILGIPRSRWSTDFGHHQQTEDDGPTKSSAGKRKIGLPPQLVQLLQDHRREQDQERAKAGQLWVETGRVFTDRFSRAVKPNSDYHAWKSLLKRAGVRETRLHDARHSAATVLLAHEVPERTVMGVMGWSSTSMAARYHPLVATTDQLRLRPQNRRLDRMRSWRRFLVLTRGGGCGIRTREGLHPTRFPSERHRPLGESSARKVTGNHKYGRTRRNARVTSTPLPSWHVCRGAIRARS
jgi:hypothetical protein